MVVITLLVLTGLAVAVDFAAAAALEYEVSEQLRSELELTADPSVRINGFPFLTQAVSGKYSEIDMQASGLVVGPLHDVGVEATLYDVTAPLAEVTSGMLTSARATAVQGRVRIRDTDLGRAIGIVDLRLQPASDQEVEEALGSAAVSESDDDRRAAVRMVATTNVSGQRAKVIVIGLLELTDGVIRITPADVRFPTHADREKSRLTPVRKPLLAAFTTVVDPGNLPFAVTPTAVSVQTGSLLIKGTTTQDVRLGQAGVQMG
ncbi:MAG: DUF2993 domain-containing protein [Actinomycetota bacterium]|nr:DUF2993 domain-containing protein [Actinomycetota bacterium]